MEQQTSEQKEEEFLLYLSIIPINYYGKTIVEIRGQIHDKEKINSLLEKAFKEDDVPARLFIRDRFKAYLRCVELGLIKENKLGEFSKKELP